MKKQVLRDIKAAIKMFEAMSKNEKLLDTICAAVAAAAAALKAGNKIMFAGNGGSAADAQHFAGELVNRFRFERPPLPAIALSTDTSVLTAVANDRGYEEVFSRQVAALGKAGDVFVGISTSGRSQSILHALRTCSGMAVVTIGMTGGDGGKMAALCNYCIIAPAEETPRIQEAHALMGHVFCGLLENALFSKPE